MYNICVYVCLPIAVSNQIDLTPAAFAGRLRLNIMSDNEADDIQRHPYSEVLKVMQKLQPHTFTKGDIFENYELHQACPK